MTEAVLDREAHRLLLSIGLELEMWILDNARVRAEARAATDESPVRIASGDIREAADAFLAGGVREFRSILNQETPRIHQTVPAG